MLRLFLVAIVLAVSVPAHAQRPADALKTCVADNTTGRDRKDLARWIFLAMAAHPEMRQYASVTAAGAMDDTSRAMASLVVRLLGESCVNETKAVVKNGQGVQAITIAFQGLGQLAMQELMADKSVQESMALFQRYVDQGRLRAALGGG